MRQGQGWTGGVKCAPPSTSMGLYCSLSDLPATGGGPLSVPSLSPPHNILALSSREDQEEDDSMIPVCTESSTEQSPNNIIFRLD